MDVGSTLTDLPPTVQPVVQSIERLPHHSADRVVNESFAHRAVALAEALLQAAKAQQTPQEHSQAQKIARMMVDPHGKELTIALADQAFRSHRPARIADQLRHLLEQYGTPRYMDWWER